MKIVPKVSEEDAELLAAIVDQTASDRQIEQLDQRLKTDPEFAAVYLAYLQVDEELNSGSLPTGEGLHEAKKLPIWLIPAIAASLAVASALLWVASNTRPPEIAVLPSSTQLGWYFDGNDQASDSAAPKPLSAGPLTIGAKVARLHFHHGVVVSLEGPANLEVISEERIMLRRGRVAAFVPEGAEGFTIGTPETDVIDLGTEFGVEVNEDLQTQVHVFNGMVQINPLTEHAKESHLTSGLVRDTGGHVGLQIASDVRFEHTRDALASGTIKDYMNDATSLAQTNNGWATPWILHQRFGTPTTISWSDDTPLGSDCGGYLRMHSTPKDNQKVRPVLRRGYHASDHVDLTRPHSLELLIRIDCDIEEIEQIFLFDAPEFRVWPSQNYTWSLAADRERNGTLSWSLYNTFETNERYERMPIERGATYRITVEVDPVNSRQLSTVSNGVTTISNALDNGTAVRFRNQETTVGGHLHLAVSAKPGSAATISLDNLRIRNQPAAFRDPKDRLLP